jgi:heptosyltransferase II
MPAHPSLLNLNPRRILVRGVNWVGDAVMTTPALLRLREHFPHALIALLTPEKLRGLWLNHPAIDEIIGFKQAESAMQVAKKIQVRMWPEGSASKAAKKTGESAGSRDSGKFDVALVLPNSPRSALEMWLARVPVRVGYARPWRNFFLTTAIPSRSGVAEMRKRSVPEIKRLVSGANSVSHFTFQDSDHHVHHYLHLVAALGANPEPVPPQLTVTPNELKAAAQKFDLGAQFTNNRPIFGLNPGAEYGPAKRWPAERFIAAARDVQKRTNCVWLLLGGKGDILVTQEIASAIGNQQSNAINLAGQTSLRELCAVLKLCRVLLTNDTGPMHIAAALGVDRTHSLSRYAASVAEVDRTLLAVFSARMPHRFPLHEGDHGGPGRRSHAQDSSLKLVKSAGLRFTAGFGILRPCS